MLAVSLNGALGNAGLLLVLCASCIGALSTGLAIVSGNRRGVRQGPMYAWLIAGGALLAVISMQRALQQRDYSLKYIQQVGSSTTPTLYNVAAMWSALEGSILLWVVVLSGFTAAVAWRFRKRLDDMLVGWALVVMFVVSAFFGLVAFGPANPFAAGPTVPVGFDGPGPNPLLQNHPLVLFHPPILYLGYVGFTVPFAFAIAALITGRVGEGWLLETRRWALFAWGFLTIGILLGGWWSYEVLGWSGVWAWDPVENASLLPWLTATAYIHSVLVQQRRGMLRVWNLSLLVATFALTILGTFLTRSGVIGSVHAFSAGEVDGYLLGFLALRRRRVAGDDRLARRPAAVAGRDRLADVARGRVPRQQRGVRGLRLHRAAGHRVPADHGGARQPPHRGRRAVLRSPVDADRDRAAVPDGGGAGAAVAQGVAGAAARPVVLAGVVRRARAGRRRRRRRRRMGAAGRVRPRRLRRRSGTASARVGHPAAGLARADGTRQRRDDRAPRRDRRRRRARGVERLHQVGRDHAAAPASRSRGRGTRSSSST